MEANIDKELELLLEERKKISEKINDALIKKYTKY